jgi:ankyrin repeat protein/uncharacterized glyoxalase superfamily protein PhnB
MMPTRHIPLALLLLVWSVVVFGAAQESPVIGIGDFPHGVSNMEQAIAFYRDVLGLELLATHPPLVDSKLGPNVYDAKMQALMDVGGAYYRFATFRIPGGASRLQLVEMVNNQDIVGLRGRRQSSATPAERGSLMLRLPVNDVDLLFKKLKDGFVGDILTKFVFRDEPDGFLIEAVSTSGAGIVLTAADADEKLRFYREILGFQFDTAESEGVRRSIGKVPGTNVPFEIHEYRGIQQRRFYPTTMGQDGVGWIQLFVRDVDDLVKVFVKERVSIVSTGLQPVAFDDSRRLVVRDPDGVFIELIERSGDQAAVRLPIEQAADVNVPKLDGMTALHRACYEDNIDLVRVLLASGANPNVATRFGVTPLALAIENTNAAIVEELLKHRAAADADTSGQRPLHIAARVGARAIVSSLLRHGAAVDARESWQSATALMVAAASGHANVVRLLIETGADVNARAAETTLFIGPGDESTTYTQIPRGGMTPLMFAARDGCEECIDLLVNAGAHVNYEDPARVTPLNLAIYNGHFDAAARLLAAGANPNDGSVYLVVDFRNLVADGVNADHHPVPRISNKLDSLEILKRLLARGANPDHEIMKELQSRYLGFERPRYLSGLTPLQRAAQQADLLAMQILLEGGADPSLPNRTVTAGGGGLASNGGETPLLFSIRSVAGVPASTLGNRPGKLAYRSREPGDSLAAAKLLLDRGADINGTDWAGTTPIHTAAALGADDIIQLLAERGARLDIKNDDGQTALDLVSRLTGRGAPPAEGRAGRNRGNSNPEATAALLRRLMGLPAGSPAEGPGGQQ